MLSVGCAVLGMLCGCATHGPRPLSPARLRTLKELAKLPEDLRIRLEEDETKFPFRGVNAVPPGMTATIALDSKHAGRTTYPLIRMKINHRGVIALVDTGLPYSLIEYRALSLTGVTPIVTTRRTPTGDLVYELFSVEAQTPQGRFEQFLGLARSASTPGLTMYKVPFAILNDSRGFSAFEWTKGQRIEAILGHDFLQSFTRVMLDFPGGEMKVWAGGYHRPNLNRLVAAVPLTSSFPIPMTQAIFEGAGPFPLALDTGGNFGLWIPHDLAKELDLSDLRAGPGSQGARKGASFKYVGDRILNFSGFELTDVPTTIATVSYGEEDPPYALLGSQVLSRYVVTLDYTAKKIYFENPR